MKRTTTIVLVTAVTLAMTACSGLDSLLQVNIFSPFAGVSKNQLDEATPAELLSLSASDSFYTSLSENPESRATVLENIETARDAAPTDSATYQDLTILAASIYIETSPAGELMGNINNALTTLLPSLSGEGGDGTAPEPQLDVILASILPTSVFSGGVVTDPVAFTAMIEAFSNANAMYVELGTAIGTTGYAEGSTASAGDVVMTAVVSAFVAGVIAPPGMTTAEYLLAAMETPETLPPGGDMSMPDMESGYLANLLAAANLNFSAPAGEAK